MPQSPYHPIALIIPSQIHLIVLAPYTSHKKTVYKYLKRLDKNKGAGPDRIHPVFINICACSLSKPLTIIFNESLRSGVFPEKWKITKVVPVFKNGDSKNVINYRPISILSAFSKIFEAVVYPYLSSYFKPYLSENQHGFVKNRSTITNLISYVGFLTEKVDTQLQVDAIYTDFSKAFDRVCHRTLLHKLSNYGFCGSMVGWFESYLRGRTNYVVLNGYRSDNYISSSGVPQGSHLGPWLFNVFINDLDQQIRNSKVLLFADDLKIARVINCSNDSQFLQDDIDGLVNWCSINNVQLNPTKCYQISFTRKLSPFKMKYKINKEELQIVDLIKDLGIFLDSKLTFIPQMDRMIEKASRTLGFILRNSKTFKNITTKKILFNTYVRSIIEYGSVKWSPQYKVHQLRIERIQKRFMRNLAYCSNINDKKLAGYNEKLKFFGVDSLPINVKPDFAVAIVKACGVLHNFVRDRDGYQVEDTDFITGLEDVLRQTQSRGGLTPNNIRNILSDYFVSNIGAVPWQMSKI
ncbi:unnamed protein product [Parnassius mnemosyne]|uniref:Reverse transcriptase domain-containing protein n=1 Tax=Parnassius mnemosyne TaxID=213953 RepID=A0AAV1LFX7_9NEOP